MAGYGSPDRPQPGHLNVAFKDVKERVLEVLEEECQDAWIKTWHVEGKVAKKMGGDGNYAGDKFAGQVKRAVDQILAEDPITWVKVGRGDRYPLINGAAGHNGNEAVVTTSAYAARCAEAVEKSKAAKEAIHERLAHVAADFGAEGIEVQVQIHQDHGDQDPETKWGGVVILKLEDAERITWTVA